MRHDQYFPHKVLIAIGAIIGLVDIAYAQFSQPGPVEPNAPIAQAPPADAVPEPPRMPSRWLEGTGQMPLPVLDAAVARMGNRLVVSGGFTRHFVATSAIQIHHGRRGWLPIGTCLLTERARHTMTALPDGRLLVVGGLVGRLGADAAPTASCEVIDPRVAGSIEVDPLPAPVAGHTALTLDDGRIAIVAQRAVHLFNPASMRWMRSVPLAVEREEAASVLVGNRVVVIGGDPAGTIEVVAVDAARTEVWPVSLDTALHAPSAARLADGTIVVVGGLDADTGRTVSTVWRLDVVARSLELACDLGLDRGVMRPALLVDGPRIAILGGEWRDAETRGGANAARLLDLGSDRLWTIAPLPNGGARRLWLSGSGDRVTMLGGYEFLDAAAAASHGVEAGPRIDGTTWTLAIDSRRLADVHD